MADGQTANDRNRSGKLAASDFRSSSRAGRSGPRTGALHVCPSCSSELVYPVDWSPADRTSWSVDLRCPDCEWRGGGVYRQQVVDAFDEELDRGTERLLDDLRLLARANMEDQVESFIVALHANWILPEDF
jgi:hypothetical protein